MYCIWTGPNDIFGGFYAVVPWSWEEVEKVTIAKKHQAQIYEQMVAERL